MVMKKYNKYNKNYGGKDPNSDKVVIANDGAPTIDEETGKPIEKGEWVCGDCQIEELNKRKMRVWGPQHPDVKAFITKEDNDCKRWNNYAKRVNENMGGGLKYKKNRYTGKTPF